MEVQSYLDKSIIWGNLCPKLPHGWGLFYSKWLEVIENIFWIVYSMFYVFLFANDCLNQLFPAFSFGTPPLPPFHGSFKSLLTIGL